MIISRQFSGRVNQQSTPRAAGRAGCALAALGTGEQGAHGRENESTVGHRTGRRSRRVRRRRGLARAAANEPAARPRTLGVVEITIS